MNVGNVRIALASALSSLSINAYSYAPDSPDSPAAFIYPDSVHYHSDFQRDADPVFIVRLLVSSTASQTAQEEMDAFISTSGANSAVAAIEVDDTLGGVVNGCAVTALRNYGVLTMPDGVRYYSAELVVEVLDSGADNDMLLTDKTLPIEVI